MSKQNELSVWTAAQVSTMDAHAQSIRAYDGGMDASWKSLSVHSFLCGRRLAQAKADMPNGNSADAEKSFTAWVGEVLPNRSYKTAQRRMQLANLLQEKLDTVSSFNKQLELLEKNPGDEKASEVVCKAMHDAMDGKGVTEFLRSEGRIREKEHQKHTPPKPLTPDEEIEAKRAQADAVLDQATSHLRHIIQSEAMFDPHLSKGKAKELLAECRAFSRAFTKKKKAKAAK